MIIVLTNSPKGERLADYYRGMGEEVYCTGEHLDINWLKNNPTELVISYGYAKIVKEDIVQLLENRIINAHPSLLPLNRGSFANFWSFIYNTPKGLTIHNIDKGIDTGKILIQEEVQFDINKETFQTTYNTIENLTFELLTSNLQKFKNRSLVPYKQEGKGSFHSLKKFELIKKHIEFEWTDNIADFLNKNDLKIQKFLSDQEWMIC